MPVDGSGNFTRSYSWAGDKAGGIKIIASRMDGEFDNYAAALNQAFWRTGIVGMTGALNMGGNAIVSVGDGSSANPAVRFNSDGTSGIFLPGVGKVALAAGGVNRVEANATGAVVTGTLLASGAVTLQSTLGVTGNTTIGGTLGVTGVSTLAAVSATNGTFSGTLGVTGVSTLAAVSATNGTFSGTLGVTGAATFTSITSTGATLKANGQNVQWGASNTAYIQGDDGAGGYIKLGTNGADRVTVNDAGTVTLTGGLAIARTGVTAPAATDGNVFSGTYTPTLTNVTNVAASTASVCQYTRIGNVVTVSGQVQIDPTAVALFDLGMSLPIASNFTGTNQLGGTFCAIDPSEMAGGTGGGAIYADTANDRANFRKVPIQVSNSTFFFTFQYLVV